MIKTLKRGFGIMLILVGTFLGLAFATHITLMIKNAVIAFKTGEELSAVRAGELTGSIIAAVFLLVFSVVSFKFGVRATRQK